MDAHPGQGEPVRIHDTKMKNNDTIQIEVLDNGIIKITSPNAISAPNHASAERLVQEIAKDAGGKRTMKHLGKHARTHTHADGTTHNH